MRSSGRACPMTLVAGRLTDLSVAELWWRYAALGGNCTAPALADYLAGQTAWSPAEHNVLSQTLNEALWELGSPSLVPCRALPDGRRRNSPG